MEGNLIALEKVISYVRQVKYKIRNQRQMYNDFSNILKDFKCRIIDIPEANKRISNLFGCCYPELIVDFNTFILRDEIKAEHKRYCESGLRNSGRPSSSHDALPAQVGASGINTPTVHLMQNYCQRMTRRPTREEFEAALSYVDKVKYTFLNQPQMYEDFVNIMEDMRHQRVDILKSIQHISNLFRGFPELIVGFNNYIPRGYDKIEVPSDEEVRVKRS